MIEVVLSHGYTGPDPPGEGDHQALADALWKAAWARREPVEWTGIYVSRGETIDLVLTGRTEVEGG
jgi:hypothetical protein